MWKQCENDMMHIVMPLPSLIADSLVKLRPFSDSTIELSGYRILSGDAWYRADV